MVLKNRKGMKDLLLSARVIIKLLHMEISRVRQTTNVLQCVPHITHSRSTNQVIDLWCYVCRQQRSSKSALKNATLKQVNSNEFRDSIKLNKTKKYTSLLRRSLERLRINFFTYIFLRKMVFFLASPVPFQLFSAFSLPPFWCRQLS